MAIPARTLLSWKTACLAMSFAMALLLPPMARAQTTISVTATFTPLAYYFDGGSANAAITLTRGRTYIFSLQSSVLGHPFRIQTTADNPTGELYPGVTNNGAQSGSVTFSVPLDAPDSLYYQCGAHFGMGGTINIIDEPMAAAPVRSDFDGDARSDIFWRNASTGENYLYPMDGRTIKPTEGYVRRVADQNWQVAGIGDFNGDGRADVLWRNSSTGENYIYMMTGTAIGPEGRIRTVADPSWQVAGVGDFDGDGKADILWRNHATGDNYIYLMDGLSIKAGEGYIRTVAEQSWQVAGVADFNGDGKADILWRNATTGENYIYVMNGKAIQPGEGYLRRVADQSWQVAGVGDFDGDGKAGILWRNNSTGENYIYEMNGAAIVAEGYIRTVADRSWQVAALGDYNGDGRADIFWRHGTTGENYVYPMGGLAILAGEGYVRTVADLAWNPTGARFPARYIAFESDATNLVLGDTNAFSDIFVHDRQTGATTRVSVATGGAQGNADSFSPAISSDGRLVAFNSNATNLVPGVTGGTDVLVHDRQTGTTTRAAVASSGTPANAGSFDLSISSDGRFVAFDSFATNLVAGDTNSATDVFVHDRQTASTTRVSVASDGTQGNASSNFSSVTSDGRFVAFASFATNLVAGDTNGAADVFVHDRQTGTTTRVSVASDGTQGNGGSSVLNPRISSDGRFVAFASLATNLVAGDTNAVADVFVHDRQTGATTRVSVASGGSQANGASGIFFPSLSMSSDGRFVGFDSDATNLVSGDTNAATDVFVHDRQTGATTRVSMDSDGIQGNGIAAVPSLSPDGRFVGFDSDATNLVSGDSNGVSDIFVHDRQMGATMRVSVAGDGAQANGNSFNASAAGP